MARGFESFFGEMRRSKAFRAEHEKYFQETRSRGEKPLDPKSWALALVQEREASEKRAKLARREPARSGGGRARSRRRS